MSKKSATNKKKPKVSKPAIAKKSAASALPFSLDAIGELADFLKAKGVAEFEWTKGDQTISLKTGVPHSQWVSSTQVNLPAASASPVPASITAPSGVAAEPASYKKVLSPFVGTFYRSPSPTSPAYVEIGKRVSPGDSLCIIEAMKLMNEIEADFAGKIVQVLVENGQAVEFGEALFVIDTA